MPSSVIARYHYNERSLVLTITFVSGSVYKYEKVPLDVYEGFLKAVSKGTFYNEKIKGVFEFVRVS